jgi:hypothetical protein
MLRRNVARGPGSGLGLGRVKTVGRAEHTKRRSSSAAMSSRAMASPLENRGAGRTRFPSLYTLSAFSHSHGHLRTKLMACPSLDRWSLAPSATDMSTSKVGTEGMCQERSLTPNGIVYDSKFYFGGSRRVARSVPTMVIPVNPPASTALR